MSLGYIYILENPSYQGLLKIGRTHGDAALRARKLSTHTAVPTPFFVSYEVYVNHYKEFEDEVHKALSIYRLSTNREFFKMSLEDAVNTIDHLKQNPYYLPDRNYEAIEILPTLLIRFGTRLDSKLESIKIFQDHERIYLEFTKSEYVGDYLKDQYIIRRDLGFICEDYDNPLFLPTVSIKANTEKFLELDDVSLLNCVGEIFV